LQPERVSNPVEDLDLGDCGDLVVEGECGFDDDGAFGAGREEGVELGCGDRFFLNSSLI
jgi:hypothetical protein